MVDRRRFLAGGMAAISLTALGSDRESTYGSEGQVATYTLVPAASELFRNRLEMHVKGNIHLSRNELVSRTVERKIPLDHRSVLDYEERLYHVNGQELVGSRRHFLEAISEGETARKQVHLQLRQSAREVACHVGGGRSTTYALDAFLTPEELDLIQPPANSLAINLLIPQQPLALEQAFPLQEEGLRILLHLDGIQEHNVEGTLVSVDAKAAKLTLVGTVQGSAAGVPTRFDLAGKMTYSLEQRQYTWLAMGIRERREIGKAEPGFEVSATLKLVRKPLDATTKLGERPLGEQPGPAELLVNLYSTSGKYAVLMDRRWQMISQSPSLSRLRMVENDRDVAQCDVRHLPPLKPGQQVTLEGLESDLRRSLGSSLHEVLHASEDKNSSDVRVVRFHAMGSVSDVPVEWFVAYCSDDQGNRIFATFTMASENVDVFSGADDQFVHSIRFLDLSALDEHEKGGADPGVGSSVAPSTSPANPQNVKTGKTTRPVKR